MSEEIRECKACKELTEYFLQENAGRKGYAICEEHINEYNIVPLYMPYEPEFRRIE